MLRTSAPLIGTLSGTRSAMKFNWLLAAALLLSPTAAVADNEARNTTRIFASRYGNCFAKSVPMETYGEKGVTKVFLVGAGTDRLVHTYNWYAPQVFLECNVAPAGKPVAVSVARIGPWPRGRRANASDLAIAFYRGGQLLKRYSTLDIADAPDNVSASVSHYSVLDHIDGYRWGTGNEYSFQVRTVDGRSLSFDAATGALIGNHSMGMSIPQRHR
ncbi:MAG: hypothetical protein EXR27_02920 [Betaproteobacteria bacterium]|nr:hypothetical protein [Betaproteobacteria bacterium]